jgi:glycosyltransferase involved in cell wall biosynthesis
MKIAVYTIVKNEAQFIERWAKSCEDADLKLIVDTGSTDDTVGLAIKFGCQVEYISIDPWRFDSARNAALGFIPEDYDFCIALDADEVLVDGWRDALEKVPDKTTRPRYKYVWSWNEDGSEGLVYSGDKIHARKNYYWHHPVHEVLKSNSDEVQHWVDVIIHHHPDQGKSRSQYLPLLELAVKEDPDDDRNRFYLGRELMFNQRHSEAVPHLLVHLQLSKWKPERATSMRYLSRMTPERLEWLLRACAEAPGRREPWVELAQHYYAEHNWPGCYHASSEALKIKEKPLEYLCEAEAWGALPYDLHSISAWHIGAVDTALDSAISAYQISGEERIEKNIQFFLRQLAKTKVEAIIPFKSNILGLKSLLYQLKGESMVSVVRVICDGENAWDIVSELLSENPGLKNSENIKVIAYLSEKSNIHHMWNLGLQQIESSSHALFINDDVSIEPGAVDICSAILDLNDSVQIVCPNYDKRNQTKLFESVVTTCRGRYDGSGGLAGFCMMIPSSFAQEWYFDEEMKWWYGDDDILRFVTVKNLKLAGIAHFAHCSHVSSWTIDNDPPPSFARHVQRDRQIFEKKWSIENVN